MAIPLKPNSWEVNSSCPQCGAPVVLEETDRILSCAYCRVRLALAFQGTPRYCLVPPSPGKGEGDRLLVPYWRFKGLVFHFTSTALEHRVIDTTGLAAGCSGLPSTLGLRPQVLPLNWITPEIPGKRLIADRSFNLPSSPADPGGDFPGGKEEAPAILHSSLIGETRSLIYTPIEWQQGRAVDALTGRPLGSGTGEDLKRFSSIDQARSDPVRFIPVLCPRCGWDLQGEKDTQVLLCRNCGRAWQAGWNGLESRPYGILNGRGNASHYLPFWRIRVEWQDLPVRSYYDLFRLVNLPRLPRPEWEEQPVYFWLPAFKISPHLLVRLAKGLSLYQPSVSPGEDLLPRASFYPVTLPLAEAEEAVPVALVSMAAAKQKLLPVIVHSKMERKEGLLAYLPFRLSGSEFIQPEMGIGILKNALHFGRFI